MAHLISATLIVNLYINHIVFIAIEKLILSNSFGTVEESLLA
jgi:hypothetical protein